MFLSKITLILKYKIDEAPCLGCIRAGKEKGRPVSEGHMKEDCEDLWGGHHFQLEALHWNNEDAEHNSQATLLAYFRNLFPIPYWDIEGLQPTPPLKTAAKHDKML